MRIFICWCWPSLLLIELYIVSPRSLTFFQSLPTTNTTTMNDTTVLDWNTWQPKFVSYKAWFIGWVPLRWSYCCPNRPKPRVLKTWIDAWQDGWPPWSFGWWPFTIIICLSTRTTSPCCDDLHSSWSNATCLKLPFGLWVYCTFHPFCFLSDPHGRHFEVLQNKTTIDNVVDELFSGCTLDSTPAPLPLLFS